MCHTLGYMVVNYSHCINEWYSKGISGVHNIQGSQTYREGGTEGEIGVRKRAGGGEGGQMGGREALE